MRFLSFLFHHFGLWGLSLLLLVPQQHIGGIIVMVEGRTKSHKTARKARTLELRLLRQECATKMISGSASPNVNYCVSSVVPEERINCILDCMSPTCYQQVYSDDPLEDGEVDPERYIMYEQCLRQDIKERNNNKDKKKERIKNYKNNLQESSQS